jgi:hypothetical protein
MPSDPSAPENSSRLPHERLIERSIPGIENASPEQLIRADGVAAGSSGGGCRGAIALCEEQGSMRAPTEG